MPRGKVDVRYALSRRLMVVRSPELEKDWEYFLKRMEKFKTNLKRSVLCLS
jgi:hypothetical protein